MFDLDMCSKALDEVKTNVRPTFANRAEAKRFKKMKKKSRQKLKKRADAV